MPKFFHVYPRTRRQLVWLVALVSLVSAGPAAGQFTLPITVPATGPNVNESPALAPAAPEGTVAPAQPVAPVAPVPPPPPPAALASPDATLTTFLQQMDKVAKAGAKDDQESRTKAFARAIACLDLSKVNAERSEALASKLVGVLNRLGMYFGWLPNAETLSDETEIGYFPSWRFASRMAELDEGESDLSITFAKQADGRWLFSDETVVGIDALFISLESLEVLVGVAESEVSSEFWLREIMPASMRGKILLTLEYWQWGSLLVFIFLGIVLSKVSQFIARLFMGQIIVRQGGAIEAQSLRSAGRPVGHFVMAILWINVVGLLSLPDMAYTIIQGAARFFAVLATTFFAWRNADLLADVMMKKAQLTATKLDNVLVPMVHTTVRIFIIAVAVIYGALSFNVDITPLLASLTIGGLGFAFAAKDTLENFFGSATVLVDRPFGVGDWVVIGDVEGDVETIGFRSTRIRTFYNSLVTIPNANLVRANVDNYGKRRYRRYRTYIGIEYDTPPDKISAFIEGIREIVRAHPYTRKDYHQIYLNRFGASALEILLYVFHETPDWATELRERERLMLDIIRLASALGVNFAFPTQTLHISEVGSAPAGAPFKVGSESDAMQVGVEHAREIMRDQAWREEVPAPVRF